jgi:hypothetical protein
MQLEEKALKRWAEEDEAVAAKAGSRFSSESWRHNREASKEDVARTSTSLDLCKNERGLMEAVAKARVAREAAARELSRLLLDDDSDTAS